MPITSFDHVNVRTTKLDEMLDWYAAILGLYSGPRPNFGFPGAWLYLGDHALVHLVGIDGALAEPNKVSLEHFALRATGLKEFLAKLEAKNIEAKVARVPGLPIVQVNVFDPEGNHIHVDFDAAET
ncbi:VOC family protein [Rhodobacteraceae bacterium]|nr:VOC family protein [Paracoccaceae bacterium]